VERATKIINGSVAHHAHHSTEALAETQMCKKCTPNCPGSWKRIADAQILHHRQ
jgi:hypothetical protein